MKYENNLLGQFYHKLNIINSDIKNNDFLLEECIIEHQLGKEII